jgi:hypothetical protein
MAVNIVIIPGADEIGFFLRNYEFADLETDLPALAMGIASDQNKICFKNGAGVLRRLMNDT